MKIQLDTKKKKIVTAICVITAVAIIVASVLLIKFIPKQKIYTLADAGLKPTDEITVIAHRGMTYKTPENSIESAKKAAGYKYTHIEFDIRRTKDGVWVLMHDEDIKRTTDGKGKVNELTYKQILDHKIDKNSSNYKIVAVPSLDEMLSTCARLNLHPVIEIKESGTDFIESLMNFIGYRTSKCTIISFDREQVKLIDKILSEASTSLALAEVELYWLTNNLNDATLEKAKTNTNIGVSFNGNQAGTSEEIKKFTDAGIKLATWTIDKPERFSELYSLGIRTITTNFITPDGIFTDPEQEVTKYERR